jgi:hypothetical protein
MARWVSRAALLVGIVFFAAGLTAWCGPGAEASPGYRVVLKSGEVLPDVDFALDYEFRVLRLRGEGEERAISFAEVASIHSGDRDVTEEILSGTVRRPEVSSDSTAGEKKPVPWRSEKSPEYKAATAPRWRGAVGGCLNYSIPIGNYYTGFKAGVGFDGNAMIAVSRAFALRGVVSKSGITLDDPYSSVLDVTVMRYSLSGVSYRHLTNAPEDRSFFYGAGGLGVVNHNFSVTGYGLSAGESDLFITTGLGVIKAFGKGVGLDANVTLDEVFGSTLGGSTVAFLLDFKIGLVGLF